MATRKYVRASGRSRYEDLLLKILKLCLRNDAILKSFKGKLIADLRHKNANVQVRDKALSWPEAVRKG